MNYSKIFRYNVLLLVIFVLIDIFFAINYKIGELPPFLEGVMVVAMPLLFVTSIFFAIISMVKKGSPSAAQSESKDTGRVNKKRVIKSILIVLGIVAAVLPFTPLITNLSSLWLAGIIAQLFFSAFCWVWAIAFLVIAAFIKEN